MNDDRPHTSGASDPEAYASVRMRDVFGSLLDTFRFEPVSKRVRATLGGQYVVDSVRAVLVWEPRRVVPGYAVPAEDVAANIVPVAEAPVADHETTGYALPNVTDRLVLDPRVPFAVRSTPGAPVELRTVGGSRADGFLPDIAALPGYVVLSFGDFEAWFEEDDEIISHPHDPFARIDVRRTSRHFQVMHRGQVLADTTRARILYETTLPERIYMPIEDVRVPLRRSATHTLCSYKGEATYFAVATDFGELEDAVWQYEAPLVDATEVRGFVSFFDERLDVVVDGTLRDRPKTPWS